MRKDLAKRSRQGKERGVVSIEYISTTSMLADGLTKPLTPMAFAHSSATWLALNVPGIRQRLGDQLPAGRKGLAS